MAFSEAVPKERTLVAQKEAMVRRLLTDSPAVARIDGGSNDEARDHFRSARESHESAVKRMAAADFKGAEQDLNKAMSSVGKARRLVPDAMRRAVELRVRNDGLIRTIDSLRASYEAHIARLHGLPRDVRVSDPILEKIAARVVQARSFLNAEHVEEANAELLEAERDLMRALGGILGSTTIEYAKRFATLAEEFVYETERNRSYEELIPLARLELRPSREALEAMDHFVAANGTLTGQAKKLAALRQYASAIEALHKGTIKLQSALSAAGLTMPKEK